MQLAYQYVENQMSKDDLSEAKRVLMLEAFAIEQLQQSLDSEFVKAIEIVHRSQGHVIVTGMGKSGHVGRKIAATLASTGTPAFFVHPAEASHGDLGMISRDDVLLALSNSGETSELSDVLSFSRRYSLPLIAITQRPQSTLAQMADVALILPLIEEACPLGLAPTTSTTMMMALGDAFATTLLKHRGFSPEDFGNLHPGGKLGQRLIKVEQIMHRDDKIPLVSQDVLMQDALITMSACGFGTLGLIDHQGTLKGVITDGDLRRHMTPNLLTKKAADVMTPNPKTISSCILAEEALALMNERKITNFFVVDKHDCSGRPIGFLHIHDCLRIGLS